MASSCFLFPCFDFLYRFCHLSEPMGLCGVFVHVVLLSQREKVDISYGPPTLWQVKPTKLYIKIGARRQLFESCCSSLSVVWQVLSDEQMSKDWPFSLLSNWLGFEHCPVVLSKQKLNNIYPNYSDLTRPHPKWQCSRGTPQQLALFQGNLGWWNIISFGQIIWSTLWWFYLELVKGSKVAHLLFESFPANFAWLMLWKSTLLFFGKWRQKSLETLNFNDQ